MTPRHNNITAVLHVPNEDNGDKGMALSEVNLCIRVFHFENLFPTLLKRLSMAKYPYISHALRVSRNFSIFICVDKFLKLGVPYI
ncbi:LOW QUALITY PROTEIN: hypothetical protein NC652_000051 [Populus alba x Populus x berolinensis]|nr:LOW QUALITY PROTEIN: hypothetical protein NC652_000051 [Populus alba x Populus x berolinensis]